MYTKDKNKKTWDFPKKMFYIFFFCIFLLYIQLTYLSLSPSIYGKNMDKFAANRNTVKQTIVAKRGTIYDINNNVLALNVSSYTVIAYLSEKRSEGPGQTLHVKDIDATSEALATVLEADASYIKNILVNGKKNNAYQVELGTVGKGITELKKEEIEALDLSGIDFIQNQKRYYPNGDFASYIVGYAREKEVTTYDDNDNEVVSNDIVGELGIEARYDDLLKGTNGYLEYQQDRYGYKITGTKEISIDAEDGYDIYLTIDAGIQRFVEAAVKQIDSEYSPEWVIMEVMDAKTGDILASSSTPSFDPNVRNITNYENPLVSYQFEPGSTMKTFTYMCAMENNQYNGSDTFLSGNFKIGNDTVNDWNRNGWGTITFDKGYEYSSNVGIANLVDRYITKKELQECFQKYGFGSKTGIELTRELTGSLKFNYPIEVAAAGFGQGITVTPIQMLQALTLLSNDGKMLKPHIVSKIVNPDTNEVYYERKIEESDQLIKTSTVTKLKELMYNTVQGTDAGTTGYPYKIEGFDIIGKTGTSQIYDSKLGTYLSGENDYIFSFSGMYPKDDPEIIIYAAMKRPKWGKSSSLSKATKDVMQSIAKYKSMFTDITNPDLLDTYVIESYTNKKVEDVKSELEQKNIKAVIIGDGEKIVKQSLSSGTLVVSNDIIILVTNGSNYLMPDMTNWSRNDCVKLFNLFNIKYNIDGYGYATSQSVSPNTVITNDMEITITLNNKLDDEVTEESTNEEDNNTN